MNDDSLVVSPDKLYTYVGIATPPNPRRAWCVAAFSDSWIVWRTTLATSPALPALAVSPLPFVTNKKWFFREEDAHLLKKGWWDALGLPGAEAAIASATTASAPVFVRIREAPDMIEGFVVARDKIESDDPNLTGIPDLETPQKPTKISKETVARNNTIIYSTDGTKKPERVGVLVESSRKGQYYKVRIYHDLTVSCDCRAWINRRTCRHIIDAAVLDKLENLMKP